MHSTGCSQKYLQGTAGVYHAQADLGVPVPPAQVESNLFLSLLSEIPA
jgi:hypothetical protein